MWRSRLSRSSTWTRYGVLPHVKALRASSTAAAGSSTSTDDSDDVIRRADWKSTNFYSRLGLTDGETDVAKIKRHYRILAKHFHPDSPSAPPDGADAFVSVHEAHEALLKQGADHFSATFGRGMRWSQWTMYEPGDAEGRRAKIRFLGDGVLLFLLGCLVYLVVVARRNRSEVGSSYLSHFLAIFLAMQFLPRFFAAVLFFSVYSSCLVQTAVAERRAGRALSVDRLDGGMTRIVVGCSPVDKDQTSVEVVVAAPGKPAQTLCFDKGHTQIILPPLPVGTTVEVSTRFRGSERGSVGVPLVLS